MHTLLYVVVLVFCLYVPVENILLCALPVVLIYVKRLHTHYVGLLHTLTVCSSWGERGDA